MLILWWTTVADAGPTSNRRRINVWRFGDLASYNTNSNRYIVAKEMQLHHPVLFFRPVILERPLLSLVANVPSHGVGSALNRRWANESRIQPTPGERLELTPARKMAAKYDTSAIPVSILRNRWTANYITCTCADPEYCQQYIILITARPANAKRWSAAG